MQQTICKSVLKEDATALQFDQTRSAVNVFKSPDQAVEQFSEILLPGLKHAKKTVASRSSEKQIVSKYLDLVTRKDRILASKIQKDARIETSSIQLKFELAW